MSGTHNMYPGGPHMMQQPNGVTAPQGGGYAHMPNGNGAANGAMQQQVKQEGVPPPGSSQSTATYHNKQDGIRNQILKQQRLLLFLRHCAKCKNPDCTHAASCATGKELWHHLVRCKDEKCKFPRCLHARELLRHYQKCQKPECSICGPVRKYVEGAQAMSQRQASQGGEANGAAATAALAPAPNGMHMAPAAPQNGMHMQPQMMGPGVQMQQPGMMGGASGHLGGPGGHMGYPGGHNMQHMGNGMMPMHGMHANGMARGVKRESDMMQRYGSQGGNGGAMGGFPGSNGLLMHGGEPDMKRHKPQMVYEPPPEKQKSMAEIKVRFVPMTCLAVACADHS